MTAPVPTIPKWKQELLAWTHAVVAGALSALASALDVASTNHVLSFKTLLHAVAIGALVRLVGLAIAKVGP